MKASYAYFQFDPYFKLYLQVNASRLILKEFLINLL